MQNKQTEERKKKNCIWNTTGIELGALACLVKTIKWNGQMSFCSLNTPRFHNTIYIYIHLFLIYAKNELIITHRHSISITGYFS